MRKKNIFHALFTFAIMVSLLTSSMNIALANTNPSFSKSNTLLYFEDKKIPATVYQIDSIDYVPFAAVINSFGMKAHLNNENNVLVITQDETLNTEKEFYDMIDNGQHIIEDSPHTMEFYGNSFRIDDVKLVDGYNLIPVSALGDLFGYQLLYDRVPNAVVMTDDSFYGLDEETYSLYSRYMQENTIPFTLDNLDSLKSIHFENYNVYLLGENHAIGKNTDIRLSFMKFLHENYGVRYLIDESGYCDAMLFNLYLETGDASMLQEIIESVKGTFGYTKELEAFYKNLYTYNKTLPDNEKIIMIGIDVQHNWEEGLEILQLLVEENKEKPVPDTVQSVLEIMKQEEHTAEEIKAALTIMDENKPEFEQYFADKYFDFYYGMRSVWQSLEFYKEHDFSVRERFIHENIRDYYTALDMDKCFGMFGGAHTMLDGMMGEDKNLAQYLNTEFAPTQNKVLSIMCMYENSYYMDKRTGEAMPVVPNYGKRLNQTLAAATTGNYGICPTDTIQLGNDALSDMFQYMLCIKDSPAATPYGKLTD